VAITVIGAGGVRVVDRADDHPRLISVRGGEIRQRAVDAGVDHRDAHAGTGDTDLPQRGDTQRLVVGGLKLIVRDTVAAGHDWHASTERDAFGSHRAVQ
jgi:hypothetical protein